MWPFEPGSKGEPEDGASVASGPPVREVLELAFSGEEEALEELVARLTPVIVRRVVRSMVRSGRSQDATRDLVRDLTQDVFLDLFANDAWALRGWRPERGLSLENFVGLVAERRTFRRLERDYARPDLRREREEDPPWPSPAVDPERRFLARAAWVDLLHRLEDRLSVSGWQVFQLLFVEECSIAEVEAQTGLRRDAVYAWRSRLRKLVRSLYEETTGAAAPEPGRAPGRSPLPVEGGGR